MWDGASSRFVDVAFWSSISPGICCSSCSTNSASLSASAISMSARRTYISRISGFWCSRRVASNVRLSRCGGSAGVCSRWTPFRPLDRLQPFVVAGTLIGPAIKQPWGGEVVPLPPEFQRHLREVRLRSRRSTGTPPVVIAGGGSLPCPMTGQVDISTERKDCYLRFLRSLALVWPRCRPFRERLLGRRQPKVHFPSVWISGSCGMTTKEPGAPRMVIHLLCVTKDHLEPPCCNVACLGDS